MSKSTLSFSVSEYLYYSIAGHTPCKWPGFPGVLSQLYKALQLLSESVTEDSLVFRYGFFWDHKWPHVEMSISYSLPITGTHCLTGSPSKGSSQGYSSLPSGKTAKWEEMVQHQSVSLPWVSVRWPAKNITGETYWHKPFHNLTLFTVCRVWWHNSSWELHRHKPPLCCKTHYPHGQMNQHVPSTAARTDQHCLPLPNCQMNFCFSIWHQQPHKFPTLRVVAVLFMLCSPSYSYQCSMINSQIIHGFYMPTWRKPATWSHRSGEDFHRSGSPFVVKKKWVSLYFCVMWMVSPAAEYMGQYLRSDPGRVDKERIHSDLEWMTWSFAALCAYTFYMVQSKIPTWTPFALWLDKGIWWSCTASRLDEGLERRKQAPIQLWNRHLLGTTLCVSASVPCTFSSAMGS